MHLPQVITSFLMRRVAQDRAPDYIIGSLEDPYMLRWWVIPRNKIFNIYLHSFLRSDDDAALHDHPWANASIILDGEYTEHTIENGGIHHRRRCRAGEVRFRRPAFAHRVEIEPGATCWSLFITGPVVRTWGFHCPDGWKAWTQFLHRDADGHQEKCN